MNEEQLAQLRRDLPPAFSRQAVPRLMPGLIASGTLANLDSLGLGPRRIRLGKRVGYTKDDFLSWFSQRSQEAA